MATSPNPITIRRVRSDDAQALYDFFAALSPASRQTFAPFGQRPTLSQYEDVVYGNTLVTGTSEVPVTYTDDKYDLVAVADGHIVGWGFAWALQSTASHEPVFGLAVADAYHSQGLGGRLMDGVLDEMRLRGLDKLYLTVVTDNAKAWGLYGRRGFTRYGAFVGTDGLPYYRMVARPGATPQENTHMQWLNEPTTWLQDGDVLTVTTNPKSDFWRKTHYGFVRDNGHFYHQGVTGDFTAEVKVTGSYHDLYDHAGIMLRLDETTWIKCGVEFYEGMQHISAVVTRDYSDWSIIPAPHNPPAFWLRVKRMGNAVEIHYSFDGVQYSMMRQAHLTLEPTLSVGPMCASPEGNGFEVRFEGYRINT